MAEDRDTFAAAITLIGMAVDPKATSARLAELSTALEKATAAQSKLDNDRAEHATAVAAAKASADERAKALRDREVAVSIAERNLARRQKAIRDAMPPRFADDPNLGPGGPSHSGLTREALNG
jgi:hypothetical protein